MGTSSTDAIPVKSLHTIDLLIFQLPHSTIVSHNFKIICQAPYDSCAEVTLKYPGEVLFLIAQFHSNSQ